MPISLHQAGADSRGGSFRGFLAVAILVMFFICTQNEWSEKSAAASRQGKEVRASMSPESPQQKQEALREQLLYQLAVSNEKLERENQRLRKRLALINHALRSCGTTCKNATSLLPFDAFLDEELKSTPSEHGDSHPSGVTTEQLNAVTEGIEKSMSEQEPERRARPHPNQELLQGSASNSQMLLQQRGAMPGLEAVDSTMIRSVRSLRGSSTSRLRPRKAGPFANRH